MEEKLNRLKSLYHRVADLQHSAALLDWDQETYMPSGASDSRAHQAETLTTIAHEIATSTEVGDLLNDLSNSVSSAPAQSNDRRLVEVGLDDFRKASRLSPNLVGRLARAISLAKDNWKEARDKDDFDKFAPHLSNLIELNKEKAEARGYEEHIYDALLDEYEPDLTVKTLDGIFTPLRTELVDLVDKIAGATPVDDSVLKLHYPHDKQWDFGLQVIRDFGYDFSRGRQDLSAHPFTIHFSINDVRITTRIDEHFFNPGFFGTLHEAGHALYEQGVDPELERLPLATGTSLGVHESQSRLWENLVGRSRPFWQGYFGALRESFPRLPADASAESIYRAVNAVERSLIRVEADEVTYNLHIMVRYELEKSIFDGSLEVSDLPEAWNQKIEDYLNVRPTSNVEGVLQDIHWAIGAFGYFPTYSLGNLMSTQLFDTMARELPNIDEMIRSGSFGEIKEWLRSNVHCHGRKLKAADLLQQVTGSPIDSNSWLNYVKSKYADIYGL